MSVLRYIAFFAFSRKKKKGGFPPSGRGKDKKRDRTGNPHSCLLSPISNCHLFSKGELAPRSGMPNNARPEGGRKHACSRRLEKIRRKPVLPSFCIILRFPSPAHFLFFPVSALPACYLSLTASCPANSTLLFVSDFPWHVESISSGTFSSGAFLLCLADFVTSFTYCG